MNGKGINDNQKKKPKPLYFYQICLRNRTLLFWPLSAIRYYTRAYRAVDFSDIDECVNNLCDHGATCVDQVNGYSCLCVPGYTDTHCETG